MTPLPYRITEAVARPVLPMVFVPLARCPECGEPHPKIGKTLKQSDGSELRYASCRRCESRFKIVAE